MVPLLATLFLTSLFGTLAGCNTLEGAGKDIQHGGKAMRNVSEDAKNEVKNENVFSASLCSASLFSLMR
jgi:predicted small secreted protein